ELRWGSVGTSVDAFAEIAVPVLAFGDDGFAGRRIPGQGACRDRCRSAHAGLEKGAARCAVWRIRGHRFLPENPIIVTFEFLYVSGEQSMLIRQMTCDVMVGIGAQITTLTDR